MHCNNVIESIHNIEDQFDPTLTNLMILAQICKALLFCLFVCLLFKQPNTNAQKSPD